MLLIHSSQIPREYLEKLGRLMPGLQRLALPENRALYPSISSHPDILFFQVDNRLLIHSPGIDKKFLSVIKRSGVRLIPSVKSPCGRYPETASLNAVLVGDKIIHRLDITDPVIKDLAAAHGFRILTCPQGYARCSTIPVGHNSLITSDPGIEGPAKSAGIDTFLISSGHITLPGEDYGFIGGATGLLPDGKILFLGDIKRHLDFAKIENIIFGQGVEYLCLAGLPLYDAGSLIFIN